MSRYGWILVVVACVAVLLLWKLFLAFSVGAILGGTIGLLLHAGQNY